MDYAQLQNLDTSRLSTAAETAGSLSGTLAGRGGEVAGRANIPAGMWQGDDATAASSLMSPLSNPLYDVSDSASQSQGVLQTLVSELTSARDRLGDAHDLAAGTPIIIGPDGTITVPDNIDEDDRAEYERKARQIREIIDEALEMAEASDRRASGALAGLGETMLGAAGSAGSLAAQIFGPDTSGVLGQAGWGTWSLGQLGNLASIEQARRANFVPTGRDGRPLNPRTMSIWRTGWEGARPGNFEARSGQSVARANWASVGTWASRVGNVATLITSTAGQIVEDSGRDDLSNTQRTARAVYSGGVQGGAAIAGAKAGAWVGAGVGAAVGSVVPGVGTAIGGAVGGIVGGAVGAWGGSELGSQAVDRSIDAFTDGVEMAENLADSGPDSARNLGRNLGNLTPW